MNGGVDSGNCDEQRKLADCSEQLAPPLVILQCRQITSLEAIKEKKMETKNIYKKTNKINEKNQEHRKR